MTVPDGFAPVLLRTTYRIHLVGNVAGGPEDGSLWGFLTLCGMRIEEPGAWLEKRPDEARNWPICKTCERALSGPNWRAATSAEG
jgi:hypothetical protein